MNLALPHGRASLIGVGLGGDDARLVVGFAWVGAWRWHGYVVREPRLKHHYPVRLHLGDTSCTRETGVTFWSRYQLIKKVVRKSPP